MYIYKLVDKYAQLLSHLSSIAFLWTSIDLPMLLSLGFRLD